MSDDKATGNEGRLLFFALLALLVWAPLPLGSNRVWAFAILEIGAFLVMACWVVEYSRSKPHLPAISAARGPLIILLAWTLYLLFQAIPLPQDVIALISPHSQGVRQLNLADETGAWIPISIDQGSTLTQFLKACSYITIFFLTLALVNSPKRLKITMIVLITVGVAESVYGMFNTLTGIEHIWWKQKTAHQGFVTGTFANKNHFAAHLEMIIPIAIGMLISLGTHVRTSTNSRSALMDLIFSMLEKKGQLVALILLMFTALFLSVSYAGIVSLLTALTITLGFSFIVKGNRSHEARFVPFMLIVAVIAGLIIGSGWFSEKLAKTSPTQTELNTERIIHDYTITGTGAGTLQYIFPMYEDGSLYSDFNHAHNDYLEVLSDQGIIGFLLGASAIFALLIRIGKAYMRKNDLLVRGVLFAALAGSTSLLFHALVDFNFQIPANAIYFLALLALGISASVIRQGDGD